MKKTLIVFLFAVFTVGVVSAQSSERKLNKKYFNLNYAVQSFGTEDLDWDDFDVLEDLDNFRDKSVWSDWGIGFSTGQTFTLTGNGILNFIHIGIDATWLDINVAHFKSLATYQSDIAMGIGASVHFTPIGKLGIHVYGRYNPTSVSLSDYKNYISYGYASGFVAGAAISWSRISLGAEARVNMGNYSCAAAFADDEPGASGSRYSGPGKINTKGVRVYLGFRW